MCPSARYRRANPLSRSRQTACARFPRERYRAHTFTKELFPFAPRLRREVDNPTQVPRSRALCWREGPTLGAPYSPATGAGVPLPCSSGSVGVCRPCPAKRRPSEAVTSFRLEVERDVTIEMELNAQRAGRAAASPRFNRAGARRFKPDVARPAGVPGPHVRRMPRLARSRP